MKTIVNGGNELINKMERGCENPQNAKLGIGIVNNWRLFGKDGIPEEGRKVELQYLDGSCDEVIWRSRPYNPHVEDIPEKWRYACC